MNPAIVPACEINNNGFLPYLSLNFPRIGPKKNANIALLLSMNPIITGELLYSCMKKGKKGNIILNPKISTNTATHNGNNLGY